MGWVIKKLNKVKDIILQEVFSAKNNKWNKFFNTKNENKNMLMVQSWPQIKKIKYDKEALDFDFIKNIIVDIRSLKAEHKLPPAQMISVTVVSKKYNKLIKQEQERR